MRISTICQIYNYFFKNNRIERSRKLKVALQIKKYRLILLFFKIFTYFERIAILELGQIRVIACDDTINPKLFFNIESNLRIYFFVPTWQTIERRA